MKKDITIIGNAVVDVLAGPVSPEVFETGSQAVRETRLSFGGDALNEAVILSRFGKRAELISKVGRDEAGVQVLRFLRESGLSADSVIVDPQTATSVNIVLVDGRGERYFLTDPCGSQRRLAKPEVRPYLADAAGIVSFASLFVSPLLDIPAMTRLFEEIKRTPGRILAADLTKAKRGETLSDLRGLLPYVDYIFPNEEEIALLTGESDPFVNAGFLLEAGVSCAAVKLGSRGCLLRTRDGHEWIPAYPVKECVDTTGAGDSFAAGFLWALSEGMPLRECGYFACAAASCAVERMGATDGIVSLEEPMKRFRKMLRSGV